VLHQLRRLQLRRRHGYTDNYAKAHTNTKTSSVTAAETVGGSLPLNDERLLHGRNSGRKTQSIRSNY